jgi:hypothetical protein
VKFSPASLRRLGRSPGGSITFAVPWKPRGTTVVELGAVGSSGFGAGFGGAVLAVIAASSAQEFFGRWQQAYRSRYPAESADAEFFATLPSDGTRFWNGEWSGRWVDRVLGQE